MVAPGIGVEPIPIPKKRTVALPWYEERRMSEYREKIERNTEGRMRHALCGVVRVKTKTIPTTPDDLEEGLYNI